MTRKNLTIHLLILNQSLRRSLIYRRVSSPSFLYFTFYKFHRYYYFFETKSNTYRFWKCRLFFISTEFVIVPIFSLSSRLFYLNGKLISSCYRVFLNFLIRLILRCICTEPFIKFIYRTDFFRLFVSFFTP